MHRIKHYLISSLITLAFLINTNYAQVSIAEVDQLVGQAMEKFNVAGVAVPAWPDRMSAPAVQLLAASKARL